MESLIDIYLYILHTHIHTQTHTHSDTVGQRMTGAVMRETETLYSALGKEGRMGDGGSEWGRNVSGDDSPAPSHSLTLLPVSRSLSTPPSPPLTPRDAHSLGTWGRAHTQVCVSVCLCMWTCETTEQKRQTDRHACEVAVDTASRYTSAFISL